MTKRRLVRSQSIPTLRLLKKCGVMEGVCVRVCECVQHTFYVCQYSTYFVLKGHWKTGIFSSQAKIFVLNLNIAEALVTVLISYNWHITSDFIGLKSFWK